MARPQSKFTADMVSDGKRLVRGEHWLLARTHLRRRDEAHHKVWSVLTLAGENPGAEIGCIRELMHRAKIVAVDQSRSAVDAACRAGADVSLHCDLEDFREPQDTSMRAMNDPGGRLSRLPKPIAELAPFDVVNLDLCCDVTTAMPIAKRYAHAVAKKGILIVTFSYGRDVAELFDAGDFGPVPAPLAGRVRAAAVAVPAVVGRVASAIAYTGNQMPMCSLLWAPGKKYAPVRHEGFAPVARDPMDALPPETFHRVGDQDLYAAVTMFDRIDPALLYALPPERMLHFRRKLAAEKAVANRRGKQAGASNGK